MNTSLTALKRCLIGLAASGAASFALAAMDDAAADLDGDGIPNLVDPDIDNDGIPNAIDPNVDGGVALAGPYAGKFIGDHLTNDNPAEVDIDDDGQYDDALGERDIDGDSEIDDSAYETDIDGDGRRDDSGSEMDADGDGRQDDQLSEDDIDGDGLDDNQDDAEFDIDGDGVEDQNDDDIDGDNRGNSAALDDDIDGDGLANDDPDEDNDDGDRVRDRDDDDDDNDGIRDNDDDDHHHEDDEAEVYIDLDRQPAAPAESRLKIEVQRMATGATEFEVEAEKLLAGAYDIYVAGALRGTLTMEGQGFETEGKVEYETDADDEDELLLDFDIFGLFVEIKRDGVVYYSGFAPTAPVYGGDPDSDDDESDEDEDDAPPGVGSAAFNGVAPAELAGLTLRFDGGSAPHLLHFATASSGTESDTAKIDASTFSYAYEVTGEATASLTVTFTTTKWDSYSVDFAAGSYVVLKYKDSAVDASDAGAVSKI